MTELTTPRTPSTHTPPAVEGRPPRVRLMAAVALLVVGAATWALTDNARVSDPAAGLGAPSIGTTTGDADSAGEGMPLPFVGDVDPWVQFRLAERAHHRQVASSHLDPWIRARLAQQAPAAARQDDPWIRTRLRDRALLER
jgi:hypothetical protein